MSSTKIGELNKDVEELNKLSTLATRSKVKDILLIETRKIETELIRLKELEASTNKNESGKVATNPTVNPNASRCYDVKLTNYAWDQSDKFVRIFVDLNGVQELPDENVKCEFSNGEMNLSVQELNNRNYTLTIKNFHMPFHPNNSHWKVKKDKVVVYLQKAKENKNWTSLTGGSEKSNKKMSDLDPNTDPSEGLMNIMKQMYNEGDDEMKRNIAKAWTEGQNKKMNDF